MKTKYILIVFMALFVTTSKSFSQSQLFDKYADMDNVSSVYISKAMFQMMPVIEEVGTSLMNLKGKVESLQLVSTEWPDQIPQMRKEFTQLVGKQHSELIRVRHSKTKATFYADMNGDKIKDLLMLADTDSSFTVIQLKGDFTLQDIQDIANEMEKGK